MFIKRMTLLSLPTPWAWSYIKI